MAWTHRTATTGFGFGETSVDVTVPGSIANLDVVDVWILCADPSDNVTCTAPDGDWTQRISVGEQDFGTRLFCFTSAGGSTTYTSPSITPTVDGALVRAGFAVDTNNDCTPITADTSPAATADGTIRAGAEQHLFVEHYEQPSAGAVTLDSTWNAAPATFVTKGVLAWAQAEEAPTGVLVVPPIRRVF
jgi:hypothetical protein